MYFAGNDGKVCKFEVGRAHGLVVRIISVWGDLVEIAVTSGSLRQVLFKLLEEIRKTYFKVCCESKR